jgi:hypothetical protein
MKYAALAVSVTLLAACGPAPQEERPTQSATAVMLAVQPGMPLDSLLYILEQHLVSALEGRLEGDAANEFRRAEALSDRLLEARLPFEWIPDQQYSLGSRLRQIQSHADRVLAQLETGVQRDTVLDELRSLREEVVRVRQLVAQGGTRAPPHIDRLLEAGRDPQAAQRAAQAAAAAAQPAAPRGPAPIGTPVPPDTTDL